MGRSPVLDGIANQPIDSCTATDQLRLCWCNLTVQQPDVDALISIKRSNAYTGRGVGMLISRLAPTP